MLVVRFIYIYNTATSTFPYKHYPRALRTKLNLNESNVLFAKYLVEQILY
jgi:hypothetical protein